ncbi:MAG TPA: thiamine-phosphate kinase, partial [Candidatus Baltobacteraceae bacterium]|nr:thiamine-phosphate kinase [Candidatus Baltobacteraceae bacterium]
AANLSDIAAMGAQPVLATVALGVTPQVSEEWILECYRGMIALATQHATRIVGGDIVRAPALTLSLTLVGEVAPARLRRRDGGRPGDVLAVTGALGASRAGLELLRGTLEVDAEHRRDALAAFATPQPRVREGRWLAASRNVHALMDVSDGVSSDVTRLARASGCGATLTSVPVHPAAQAVAEAAGADALGYALDGGEDYELLVALAPRAFSHLAKRFAQRFGRPLLQIGRLEAEPGVRLRDAASERVLAAAGWDHFAPAL